MTDLSGYEVMIGRTRSQTVVNYVAFRVLHVSRVEH